MTRRCSECGVRDQAVCRELSAPDLCTFSALGRSRRLARGETLSWAGDSDAVCANVVEGLVKLGATTADGREQMVGLMRSGDFVGRPFADRSDFTVTALTGAELCVFPRGQFERALTEMPALARGLLGKTLVSLDEARGRMLMLARGTARERVARLLLELADAAGAGQGAAFALALTRGEMAELLGLTIETVSRQLTMLRGEGAIALNGARGAMLLDRAALEADAAEPIGAPVHSSHHADRHL